MSTNLRSNNFTSSGAPCNAFSLTLRLWRRMAAFAAAVCVCGGAVAAQNGGGSHIHEYWAAAKFRDQGDLQRACEGFVKAEESARQAEEWEYHYISASNAASCAYQLGRFPDCQRMAEAALDTFARHKSSPWTRPLNIQLDRISTSGLLERCLLQAGRIGEGWQRNRATITAWREVFGGTAAAPGSPPAPAEVAGLDPGGRSLGWRLIEREAEYLHYAGHTRAALRLLEAATAAAGPDLAPESNPTSRAYAQRLLTSRALILDFIGYDEQALALFERADKVLFSLPGQRGSRIIMRINALCTKAFLTEPSADLLAEVRSLAKQMAAINPAQLAACQRQLANLEAAAGREQDALERLAAAARDDAAAGRILNSFLAERDLLLARAESGETALDADFQQMLARARDQGSKRAEPRIYRRFGDYLGDQGRHAEALAMYREALALTLRFEWWPMVPQLHASIAGCLLQVGDTGGAMDAFREMDAFIAAHPDIPASALLGAEWSRLRCLLYLGRTDEARRSLRHARTMLDGSRGMVPERLKRAFGDEVIEPLLAAAKQRPQPDSPAPAPGAAVLQPLAVTTSALPGLTAETCFYLSNPGITPLRGQIIATGPGLESIDRGGDHAPLWKIQPGAPSADVAMAMEVQPGCQALLPFYSPPPDGSGEPAEVEILWVPEDGGKQRSARWCLSWGEDAGEAFVLDAARLSNNPFIGTPVLHHVAIDHQAVAFRLRAPQPMRIEYRSPGDGRLIAIDANGNGDFSEPGDLFPPECAARRLPPAAVVEPPAPSARVAAIEVWLFPHHDPVATRSTELRLQVETFADRAWRPTAENTLELR